LNIYEVIKDKVNIPYTYNSIANEYNTQGNYELALQFHKKAFVTAQEVDNKLYMVQSLLGLAKTYIAKGSFGEALFFYKKAEPIGKEINALDELKDVYQGLSTTYAGLKSFPEAYQYQSLLLTTKDKLYDISTDKKLANLLFDFELQKKQGEITILQTDNKLRQAEIKQQRFAKNAVTIGLVLVFILAFFIYRNYRIKAKNNIILDNKNAEIEHLLLNIFPSEVAQELQKKGQATPRLYDHVSVLFSDFKGFTAIADKLTPGEVVAELNICFVAFDSIIEKYKLEKIKTIGDSYMCAGGIPAFDNDHVNNMMKASMEMLAFMEQYNNKRLEKGFEVWDIRIGIHVGPVVAGVVGRKKYAYDIWGSTVNIASRMESNGAPGLVNVSAATYELIKDDYECKHRGKVHAKNVGDIDMYFVIGEKVKEVKPENTYILPDMLYN
jgi:class 3 adenylate cyclase